MAKETELLSKLSPERRSLHRKLLAIERSAKLKPWAPIMRHHRLALLAVDSNEVDDSVGDAEVNVASNIEVDAAFALAETPPRGSDLILRYIRVYISAIDPLDSCYEVLAAAVEAFLSEREVEAAA